MKKIMNEAELRESVGGGAKKTMLVCSACHYTMDPEKTPVIILPGEVTECPRCHQVTMMIKQVNA